MTAYRVRYTNGTSALKPECSRYRNENERIIDYSRAAEQWNRSKKNLNGMQFKGSYPKDFFRNALSDAVDDSAIMRDFRSGNLSGTPVNKSDSWKMSCYAAAYTLMALVAIIGVSL